MAEPDLEHLILPSGSTAVIKDALNTQIEEMRAVLATKPEFHSTQFADRLSFCEQIVGVLDEIMRQRRRPQ